MIEKNQKERSQKNYVNTDILLNEFFYFRINKINTQELASTIHIIKRSHTDTRIYIYIYIYMCVCVCVCVGAEAKLGIF